MKTRNRDALAISAGACNPSGIALTLFDAVKEARADGVQACSDPAVVLIVSQLAYLCGVWDGVSDFAVGSFGACSAACQDEPQFKGWESVAGGFAYADGVSHDD